MKQGISPDQRWALYYQTFWSTVLKKLLQGLYITQISELSKNGQQHWKLSILIFDQTWKDESLNHGAMTSLCFSICYVNYIKYCNTATLDGIHGVRKNMSSRDILTGKW